MQISTNAWVMIMDATMFASTQWEATSALAMSVTSCWLTRRLVLVSNLLILCMYVYTYWHFSIGGSEWGILHYQVRFWLHGTGRN